MVSVEELRSSTLYRNPSGEGHKRLAAASLAKFYDRGGTIFYGDDSPDFLATIATEREGFVVSGRSMLEPLVEV